MLEEHGESMVYPGWSVRNTFLDCDEDPSATSCVTRFYMLVPWLRSVGSHGHMHAHAYTSRGNGREERGREGEEKEHGDGEEE